MVATMGILPSILALVTAALHIFCTFGVTGATPECKLELIGNPGGGLKHASLTCTAGRVTIAVNETYLGRFTPGFKGVEWDPEHCAVGSSARPRCLITFCGKTQAKLPKLVVKGIHEENDFVIDELDALLCATGAASLTLFRALITNNMGRVFQVQDEANVTLIHSAIRQNTGPEAGIVFVLAGSSHVKMVNTTVKDNDELMLSGLSVVHVSDAATLEMTGCNITGNDAGLLVQGNASLFMSEGCLVADNDGLSDAIGLSARDNSTVIIADSTISGNFGGVVSLDNSTLIMKHCKVVGNLEGTEVEVGAGVSASGFEARLTNVDVQGNYATGCAGVAAAMGVVMIVEGNSTIVGNIGRGLCAYGNSSLTITDGNVVADNYIEGMGGGLLAVDNATVNISNTVWRNNSADGSAGGAMFLSGNVSASITDSILQDNVALRASGGGIRAGEKAKVVILQCEFINNTASAALGGGGMAAAGHAHVTIASCKFMNNTANDSSGGAISVRDEAWVKVVGSTFLVNTAELEGGAIYVLDRGFVSISGSSKFVNNSANYTGADIRAGADGNLVLADANINSSSPTVQWPRQLCFPGESLQGSAGCRPCQMSTYSVVVNSSTCYPCPEGAVCSGGDSIMPKEDFWHSHKYSTQIHPCPRENICEVQGVCASGYTGNLCGECLPGYGSQGAFRCGKCMSVGGTLAAYLGAVVLLVLFTAALVQTTLADTHAGVNSVRPSDLVKILVRHLQYLVVISTIRVQWPNTMYDISLLQPVTCSMLLVRK